MQHIKDLRGLGRLTWPGGSLAVAYDVSKAVSLVPDGIGGQLHGTPDYQGTVEADVDTALFDTTQRSRHFVLEIEGGGRIPCQLDAVFGRRTARLIVTGDVDEGQS